jgi:hypothetical protein
VFENEMINFCFFFKKNIFTGKTIKLIFFNFFYSFDMLIFNMKNTLIKHIVYQYQRFIFLMLFLRFKNTFEKI